MNTEALYQLIDPSEPAPPPEPVQAEAENPDDYFYLSKPITIHDPKGDRHIDKLLLNPKKLGGRGFFVVVAQFAKLYPDDYRTVLMLGNNVNFIQLVVARLNKIVPEDLYKLEYTDLAGLVWRTSAFHYSGGSRPATKMNGKTPETQEANP